MRRVGQDAILAENTIVKRGLVLIERTASSGSRMRPVDFVGLSDFHIDAVLPIVLLGELGIILVIKVALEPLARFTGQAAFLVDIRRTAALFIDNPTA